MLGLQSIVSHSSLISLYTVIVKDERTNQNIKRALRKYVNEDHNDWDLHLQAIVYGINTTKQVGILY